MAVGGGEGVEKLEDMIVRAAETTATHIAAAKAAVGNVIFGQEDVVERTLITVLCGGHGMLVGVPGLAKTKLVEALGTVLGLDARRIQFTPDLMPSDILGSEVMEQDEFGKRSFRFKRMSSASAALSALLDLAPMSFSTSLSSSGSTSKVVRIKTPHHF